MKKVALLASIALFTVAMSGTASAADVENGKNEAKKCMACHDMTNAKKNKVGPYLWGIMGQPAGKVADYKYSEAHMKVSAEKKIVWDDKTMIEYLANPKDYIPGNKMAFAGIKEANAAADLVAFMNTLKD